MKIKYLKKPELIASALMIVWAFTLTAVAFNSPPVGCTPGTCNSPLAVDFENETVSVSQAPTASEHVATKGYVDNVVGAAGGAAGWDCTVRSASYQTSWQAQTTANCNSNEIVISGGCYGTDNFPDYMANHPVDQGWRCVANHNGANNTLYAYANCCK